VALGFCVAVTVFDLHGILCASRHGRRGFGFLHGLEALPTVGNFIVIIDSATQIVQQDCVGLPMAGDSSKATLRDDDDAECIELTQCGGDRVVMKTELDKLLFGDDQLAVVVAGVVT
jgi:hypothetical protein